MHRFSRFRGAVLITIITSVFFSGAAAAQSVLQSYTTTAPLQLGVIVQQTPKNPGQVEPLTQNNATKMFGVVVSPNSSPVSLSSTSGGHQAYVATSGVADVLVSDQDGAIGIGDYITISSVSGIGMKAGSSDSTILGKATSTFDGSNALGTTTLKNSAGHQQTVQLGEVAVSISVGRNPLEKGSASSLPGFLQRASQNISGKPVSATRVYIGLVILLISAVISGSLLYAGVRSGIIAIGRNPLSKKSIFRSLVQVTLTSLIVFIIGLFGVYLLLRF